MEQCRVKAHRGNVMAEDDTESLPAFITTSSNLSAVDMFSAAGVEDLPSSFTAIPALIRDHSYLPTHFNGLVGNACVHISGKTDFQSNFECNQ